MSQLRDQPAAGANGVAEPSVPAMVHTYRAGLVGGLLGGLAMVAVALIYGVLAGTVWLPVNLIGATVVRELQTAPPDVLSTFQPAALVAGLVIHLALSAFLGLVFALLLPTLPGPPILWSIVIGPALWGIASLLVLPAVNPVMAEYVDVPSFFLAHLVYGLVLGWWIARSPKIPVK